MGACRETFSVWFYIKKVIKPHSKLYGRWKRFKDLLFMRVDNAYFWHDSFGRYINQWFLCPLLGHRNIKWLDDGGCSDNISQWHCFNCEREVIKKKSVNSLNSTTK